MIANYTSAAALRRIKRISADGVKYARSILDLTKILSAIVGTVALLSYLSTLLQLPTIVVAVAAVTGPAGIKAIHRLLTRPVTPDQTANALETPAPSLDSVSPSDEHTSFVSVDVSAVLPHEGAVLPSQGPGSQSGELQRNSHSSSVLESRYGSASS